MTTANDQGNGRHCGNENGNHGTRKPGFRQRRAGNVAAQSFELVALMSLGGQARRHTEPDHFAHRIGEVILRIAGRTCV